jgi:hypothetical protein
MILTLIQLVCAIGLFIMTEYWRNEYLKQIEINKELQEQVINVVDMDTDFFVNNACLSYRHDFGLMTLEEQESLRFQYREWRRSMKNNGGR